MKGNWSGKDSVEYWLNSSEDDDIEFKNAAAEDRYYNDSLQHVMNELDKPVSDIASRDELLGLRSYLDRHLRTLRNAPHNSSMRGEARTIKYKSMTKTEDSSRRFRTVVASVAVASPLPPVSSSPVGVSTSATPPSLIALLLFLSLLVLILLRLSKSLLVMIFLLFLIPACLMLALSGLIVIVMVIGFMFLVMLLLVCLS
jgi:hypothetical protein